MSAELPEYASRNRSFWASRGRDQEAWGRARWSEEQIGWGIFQAAEERLQALPTLAGADAIELGCGTAYFSAWLARRGARPVAVDVTPDQLELARGFQKEFGLEFPLVEANAEDVPMPSASFDLAISEYGASIWCDPFRWVPEAARLLRTGGRLVFMRNSTLLILCTDEKGRVGEKLERPLAGLHRIDWSDEEGEETEFHLSHAAWVDLLRENGFELERLIELYAEEGASADPPYDFVSVEWASRWPHEEIWVARKI